MKTSLQVLVGNGKRFLAYEIISRLKQLNEWKLLNELSQYVSSNECKKGQKHKVFEPGFDARLCESSFMVNQKIDYIHYNPVSGKWNLADNYNEYMYSSASFYETGHSDHKWLVHVQEVM
ncbi:MAG TPA: hypothetical protein PKE63_09960 [Lacibacter sp.]|nr:hypothetical protein [Lacibacter sp.]